MTLNNFDSLYFGQYIAEGEIINKVFHRHVFIILEDIFLWIFFGLLIPGFLYKNGIFDLDTVNILYVYGYIFGLYVIIFYKFFDWYADVWVCTQNSIISVKWQWFTPNLLYIPYAKIEGVEVRTRAWWHVWIGMSDVIVKLSGSDQFALSSAADAKGLVNHIQQVSTPKHHGDDPDDREPFEVLVDTLSDVVRGQLSGGKEYITSEYVETLDATLTHGKPIDLRRQEDKKLIDDWKKRVKKDEPHDDGHGDTHDEHGGNH